MSDDHETGLNQARSEQNGETDQGAVQAQLPAAIPRSNPVWNASNQLLLARQLEELRAAQLRQNILGQQGLEFAAQQHLLADPNHQGAGVVPAALYGIGQSLLHRDLAVAQQNQMMAFQLQDVNLLLGLPGVTSPANLAAAAAACASLGQPLPYGGLSAADPRIPTAFLGLGPLVESMLRPPAVAQAAQLVLPSALPDLVDTSQIEGIATYLLTAPPPPPRQVQAPIAGSALSSALPRPTGPATSLQSTAALPSLALGQVGQGASAESLKTEMRPKQRRTYNHEAFPERLYRMLEEVEESGRGDIVSFSGDGKSFIIHKPKEFSDEIIPAYFRHSKFASFRRQLSMYGFRRVTFGQGQGTYAHDLFVRSQPQLCKGIKRVTEFEVVLSPRESDTR